MNVSKIAVMLGGGGGVAALSALADPVVSNVTMSQADWPEVVVGYALVGGPAVVTLDIETNATGTAEGPWVSIGGENIQNVTGDVWTRIENGSHEIRWRPDMSWPGHKIDTAGVRAKVTAWPMDNTPDYMVVDIAENASSATPRRYYPNAGTVPGGVLANKDYRTTKLLFRKIIAKDITWTMGSRNSAKTVGETLARPCELYHSVTLTNNYYIGVFEVTQSQFAHVQTNFPESAYFKTDRSMRPMEGVCYNEIRLTGSSRMGYSIRATDETVGRNSWPAEPANESFLGLLHLKTGVWFDLPSDAQWEYAARAMNGPWYWGNNTLIEGSAFAQAGNGSWIGTCEHLDSYGRYRHNGGWVGGTVAPSSIADCPATNGTAIAGSYEPNDWGLYDMAGNVWEWCLDWYADDITGSGFANGGPNIDVVNPTNDLAGVYHSSYDLNSSPGRVRRGGAWCESAYFCRSGYRSARNPGLKSEATNDTGFRLVCNTLLK